MLKEISIPNPISLCQYILYLLLIICLYLSSMSVPVQATTYYVDSVNGNDSNNGTSLNTPWKSIFKVNGTLFLPGDNIYFKRGNIWREQLIISSSGTKEMPIIFGAYGGGDKPTITGSLDITGKVEDWKSVDSNIWVRSLSKETKIVIFNSTQIGVSTIKLDEPFEFNWANNNIYIYSKQNPAIYYKRIEAGQMGSIISFNNQNNVTVQEMNIYGGQLETDHVGPGGCIYIPAQSDGIIIKNNVITKCQGGGIRVIGAKNITIDNNLIKDIDSYRSTLSGDAITISWNFSTKKKPMNISIINNLIEGFIDRMGIAVLDCDGLLISNNIIKAGVTGIDIEPNEETDQGVVNAVISNNIVDKSLYSRLPVNNGISVSGDNSNNIKLENNTIDTNNSNPGIGVTVFGKVTNVSNRNNIIRNSRIGIQVGSGSSNIIFDGNHITAGKENNLYGFYFKGGSTNSLSQNTVEGPYENSVFVDDSNTSVDSYNNIFKDYAKNGLEVMNIPAKLKFIKNTFLSSDFTYHIIIPLNVIAVLDENQYSPSGNYYRWHASTYSFSGYRLISGQDSNGKEMGDYKPSPPINLN